MDATRPNNRPSELQRANARISWCRFLFYALCVLQFAHLGAARAFADESLASREELALRVAAESVADSVVQIRTIGGLDLPAGALTADGPTTGLIISPDGFIVSSAFNFRQQPASILVTLPSGKQLPAELVATDHSRMLVMLKLSGAADLPVPAFTPVEEIRPGQWAVAVGRTFRSDRTNVSVGIVSAVGRMFGKVIQTDADVSTANYGGPLVDVRGRVLGVLVPMAPQGASDVAGAEWYDSGIGFAVPLASISDQLELLKKGEDQRPGILGIGMRQENPHSSPAAIATVRPDSPAGKAGLKKGDRIVEFDGKPVATQTDLRFALGPQYAGDRVRIVAMRGEERLERALALVGELPAFRHAFLGILPMRPPTAAPATTDSDDTDADSANTDGKTEAGIVVRMVCDGSPAAETGIRAGDRILKINETQTNSIDDAFEAMNNAAPGGEVKLQRLRDGNSEEITITAARMPVSVPKNLPPALMGSVAGVDAATNTEFVKAGTTSDLKLPEFPHECKVYVPASHQVGQSQAVLLWLRSGEGDPDSVVKQWREIADRDGVMLVAPTAAENGRWELNELEYLSRLVDRVLTQYRVDRHRIVVYGENGGGAMAWLLGLAKRDLFRGIATSAAPLPRQVRVPPNEPVQRLAIFAVVPSNNDAAAVQIAEGLEKLNAAGYAVTTDSSTATSGNLSAAQRDELARWIDSLDRF